MKRVYLDQNHWISLSAARRGLLKGERFHDALAAIEAVSQSGDVSFPLAAIHYMETAKRRGWESRRDLAATMAEFSRFHTIAPPEPLVAAEMRNAVFAVVGRPERPLAVQPFGIGVAHAFDDPRFVLAYKTDPVVRQQLPPGGAWLHEQSAVAAMEELMLSGPPPEHEMALRESDPAWHPAAHVAFVEERAKAQEELRKLRVREGWGKGERARRVFLVEAFDSHFKALYDARAAAGIPQEGFAEALGQEGLNDLLEAVPTLHAIATFRMQRHVGSQKPIDSNDIGDEQGVPSAIVHCDIVVTERQHAKNLAALADRHGTILIHDLAALPSHLF